MKDECADIGSCDQNDSGCYAGGNLCFCPKPKKPKSFISSPVYYFDIDGTITNETGGWDYVNRTPRTEVIKKINILYSFGVRIVLWTSRYSCDLEVTTKWLKAHGVKYHELIMDKPTWDVYICDKSFNVNVWCDDGKKSQV